MPNEIEFTDEFGNWWNGLAEEEQDSVRDGRCLVAEIWCRSAVSELLRRSGFTSSAHAGIECQHEGRPKEGLI